MNGEYYYGIETDAFDELGRLEYMAVFISDAIGAIAESVGNNGAVNNKCWLGLYYVSQYMEDKISEIHSRCGKVAK